MKRLEGRSCDRIVSLQYLSTTESRASSNKVEGCEQTATSSDEVAEYKLVGAVVSSIYSSVN